MPYSKAHYYIYFILVITVLAFWPSYFGVLKEAPVAHHFHGITGTLWMVLIAVQCQLAHSRNMKLHRQMGKTLFLLVPLMVGAFAMVIVNMAVKYTSGHPFFSIYGLGLLSIDFVLLFSTPLFVYLGLRHRKNVHQHSAFLISSVIGLLPPILTRIFKDYVPGFEITGVDTMHRFGYALHLSMAFSLLLAILLYFRFKAHGKAWIAAAAVIVLISISYWTLGQWQLWHSFVDFISRMSMLSAFVFGLILGAVFCFLGWIHGKQRS